MLYDVSKKSRVFLSLVLVELSLALLVSFFFIFPYNIKSQSSVEMLPRSEYQIGTKSEIEKETEILKILHISFSGFILSKARDK